MRYLLHLILFIINILFFYKLFELELIQLFDLIDKKLNAENIKVITSIITSITATLNILLVIIFYNFGRKNNKAEHQLKKQSYWFRDVILDPNLSKIEEFFTEINSLGKELRGKDDQYYAEAFVNFKDLATGFCTTVVDLVKVMDESLGSNIEKIIEEFEDKFVNISLETLDAKSKYDENKAFIKLEKVIQLERNNIYKVLYSYELVDYKFHKIDSPNYLKLYIHKLKDGFRKSIKRILEYFLEKIK